MAKISPSSPLFPTKYENKHIAAIQALMAGTANEGQQKLIMPFIIQHVCLTHDEPYRPDSERDTTFALGKRHVGMELIKFTELKIGELK